MLVRDSEASKDITTHLRSYTLRSPVTDQSTRPIDYLVLPETLGRYVRLLPEQVTFATPRIPWTVSQKRCSHVPVW